MASAPWRKLFTAVFLMQVIKITGTLNSRAQPRGSARGARADGRRARAVIARTVENPTLMIKFVAVAAPLPFLSFYNCPSILAAVQCVCTWLAMSA